MVRCALTRAYRKIYKYFIIFDENLLHSLGRACKTPRLEGADAGLPASPTSRGRKKKHPKFFKCVVLIRITDFVVVRQWASTKTGWCTPSSNFTSMREAGAIKGCSDLRSWKCGTNIHNTRGLVMWHGRLAKFCPPTSKCYSKRYGIELARKLISNSHNLRPKAAFPRCFGF
jgi:hypothetical protein